MLKNWIIEGFPLGVNLRKMKILKISILVLVLLGFKINAQTKKSNNNETHQSYITKYGTPISIKKTTTFYTKNGAEIKQSIITFSKNLDTIIEKRYKGSELQAELIFVFNQSKNLIYRSFKNKVPLFGWQYIKTKYIFDETGLVSRKKMDKNGNLIEYDIIINDSLKNKISLKTFDSQGKLIGYEKTKYNYKENKKTWGVYNSFGDKMTEKTSNLNFDKNNNNKYNEYGDCTFYPRGWFANDNTYYQVKIKYDKLGNWVEKKTYESKKINGVFKNKKIYRTNKRKIKYRKG